MIIRGKGWHIDDDGILFIGKNFKQGKGFLPWFNHRESVTGLNLEEGIEVIGREWCAYLKRIKSLELPRSLKTISPGAFEDCSGIREVTIPEGVSAIGERAFMGCESLRRLSLPSTLTEIGDLGLGCNSERLIRIDVAPDNHKFSSIDGILFNKDKTELLLYPGGKRRKRYAIPASVRKIGENAFANCTSLSSFRIPDGVPMLDYAVLASCPIKEIVIPESVTEINNSAFYECTELERVILPESLTAIWEKAFRYCRSLKEITIPSKVWHITDDVFDDCPSLKKVIVRSKVLENMYWVPEGCQAVHVD